MLIIDELGFVPLSTTGAELLFEVFSQRYERGSILVTTNLPFDEWTDVFGSERLTGELLDRLTHHVHILEMNGAATASRAAGRMLLPSLQATQTTSKLKPRWESTFVGDEDGLRRRSEALPLVPGGRSGLAD